MKAHPHSRRPAFVRGLCYLLVAGLIGPLHAQTPPAAPAPSAALLAKYDRNGNGVLDPEERAAMAAAGDEVVHLSPFEVTTAGDTGYISTTAATATRIAEALQNIPQSVKVINQEFIQDVSAQTLDHILAYTAGIDLAGDENEDYQIRGHGSGQGMMDGFRQPRMFPEDTADVERVEVMMGPSSVMFGSSAGDNGIVNRVSKRPRFRRESSLQLRYVDATETLRAVFDTTGPFRQSRRLAYRVVGVFNDDERVNRKDHSYVRRFQVMPKFTYRFSPATEFFLHTEFTRTQSTTIQQLGRDYDYILYRTATGALGTARTTAGVPNAPVIIDVPDAANPEAHLVRSNLRAYRSRTQFTTRLGEHWALRAAGSSGRTMTKFNLPNVAGTLNADARTVNRGRAQERLRDVWQTFLQVDFAGDYTFDWGRVKLIGGPDYTIDNQSNHLRRAISTVNLPAFDYFAPDYSVRLPEMNEQSESLSHTRISAAFAHAGVNLFKDRLLLTGGARVTDFEQTSRTNTTNGPVPIKGDTAKQPQFGVAVRPRENVSVYASYTENIVIRSNANPDGSLLPPRVNEQKEVGVKSSWWRSRVATTAAYFQNAATNILESDPNNPGFQVAIGEQTSKGYELEAVMSLTETWQATASFTHITKSVTSSVNPANIGNVINLPKERWSVWTRYRFARGQLQGLSLGAGTIFQTERVIARPTAALAKLAMPEFQTYDAMIGYRPKGKPFRVQLNVRNLTDEKYWPRGNVNRWLAAAPRTISFDIHSTF
jgi:iron complex outermembrane recepter protein